jgi:large subunit ribosomal protein L9
MTMKVILRENIDTLGSIGDVVRVSEGYARNFLLPRNLVIVADEHNVKEMEHHRKALERRRARSMKDAQSQVAKIEGVSCTITRKAGEQDKLFGSVTSGDIATALKKDGITLDRKQIHLEEPIKQLGVFTVTVKLHPEVTAKLKVWVVAEK